MSFADKLAVDFGNNIVALHLLCIFHIVVVVELATTFV